LFGFSAVNILLYFLYPVSLIAISMYVSRNKEATVESFFFANRKIHWLISGISLLTTTLFSPYIFGFSSSGLNTSLPIVYGIISSAMLIVLGWVLVPLYLKFQINTLPDYFEKRFNRSSKYSLSALYVISNILLRLLPILALGGAYLREIAGLDSYSILLFFLVITGIYVLIGGLETEAYVNIVQVLLISLAVGVFSFWVIGRGEGLRAIELRTSFPNSEFTTAGLILGLPIIGFWYWSADQFIVQKVLSVQNSSSVKKATIISVFLQIIPVLVLLVPGIVLYELSKNQSSSATLHGLFTSVAIPEGLAGAITIGVVAALMATFANIFNSTSSLVTFDFYRSFKKEASDRELVLVGRMTTMVLLLIAILLIPISQTISFNSCLTLFKVFAYFASMVAAIFLVSLASKKINAADAMITFYVAALLIAFRAIGEIFFSDYSFENNIIQWFAQESFLEFSVVVFGFSIFFVFVVDKVKSEHISKLFSKKHKTVF